MPSRVVDPDGVAWEVARVWFGRPDWSRESPDPGDDILEDAGDRLSDVGRFEEAWWATALVFLGGLVVALLFFVLLPLLVALLPWWLSASSARGSCRSPRGR
jgi:hypothetical protein